jgi:hypothetical protein
MTRTKHIIFINKTFKARIAISSPEDFVRSKHIPATKERIVERSFAVLAAQLVAEILIV